MNNKQQQQKFKPTFSYSGKMPSAEVCPKGPSPVGSQGDNSDGNISTKIQRNNETKIEINTEWKDQRKKYQQPRKIFKMRGDPSEEEINESKRRFFAKEDYPKEPCPCKGTIEECRGFIIKREGKDNRAIEMPKEQESYERYHLRDDYRPPLRKPIGMNYNTFQNVLLRFQKREEKQRFKENPIPEMVRNFEDELRRSFERDGQNPDCPENRKIIRHKVKLYEQKLNALGHRLIVTELWKGIEVLERDTSQKQPEEFSESDCYVPWFEGCQEYHLQDGTIRFRPPYMVQNLPLWRYPFKPIYDPCSGARIDIVNDKELYFMPYYSPFFRRDCRCCADFKGKWPHPSELAWSKKAGDNIRWMGTPDGNPPQDPSYKREPWRAKLMRDMGFVKERGCFIYHNPGITLDEGKLEDIAITQINDLVDGERLQQRLKEEEEIRMSEESEKFLAPLSGVSISSFTEDLPKTESEKDSSNDKTLTDDTLEESSKESEEVQKENSDSNFEESVQSDSEITLSIPEKSETTEKDSDDPARSSKTLRRRRQRQRRHQKKEESPGMSTDTREAIQEEIQLLENQMDDLLETALAPSEIISECVQAIDSSPEIEQRKEEKPILKKRTKRIVRAKCEPCHLEFQDENDYFMHLDSDSHLLEVEALKYAAPQPSTSNQVNDVLQNELEIALGDESNLIQENLQLNQEFHPSYDLVSETQMWKVLRESRKEWRQEDWNMNHIVLSGGQIICHFFKINGIAYRPPRFNEFHNNLDLYHFLRQHRTRRYYTRMTDWYYIPKKLVDIIFPGNMQACEKREFSDNPHCFYMCRSYHQSCAWHEGLLDNELAHHRISLLKALDFHKDSANFWISLAFQVNNEDFQNDRKRFFSPPQVPKLPLAGVWERKEIPNFHYDTELMQTFLCQCGEIMTKENYDKHVLPCLESFSESEMEEIKLDSPESEGESEQETPKDPSLYQKWRDFLMQQYREQIDNLLQSLVAIYNWTTKKMYRYRRFLINMTSALLNMLFFPRSIPFNLPIILNEILSEMPKAAETQANQFCESLKHVIKRIHREDTPVVQAQTTREEDDIAANETFGRSLWEIIKSFLPLSKIDAGLLRARQLRIENAIKSLASLKKIHEFLFGWLQEIWFLIQIYLFGATREELEEAHGILSTDKVTAWVSKVDQFELQILANGRAFSKSSSMMYDYHLQEEYQQLRQEGLDIEQKLSKVKTPQVQLLHKMVAPRLKKIADWLNSLKGNLTKVPNSKSPFVLYLYGKPKVGKTLCIDSLMKILLACKYPDHPDYDQQYDRFQRSRTTAYFDGYNGQKVYVMDDAFQLNDDNILYQELGDVIDLASMSKAHLNVAQLENKAGLYFTSDFIVLTSNTLPTDHQMQQKMADFEAFNRRLDCVLQVQKVREPRQGQGFDTDCMIFSAQRWVLSDDTQRGHYEVLRRNMNWAEMVNFVVELMAMKDKREETCGEPVDYAPGYVAAMQARYQRIKEQQQGRTLQDLPTVQMEYCLEPKCHFCNVDFSGLPEGSDYVALYQHCLTLTREDLDYATRMNHMTIVNYVRHQLRPVDLDINPTILDAETVREVRWLQDNETPDIEGSFWNFSDVFASGNSHVIRLYAIEARHRQTGWTWKRKLLYPFIWIQSQYRWIRGEAIQSAVMTRNTAASASSAVAEACLEVTSLIQMLRSALWISGLIYITSLIIKMAYNCIKGGIISTLNTTKSIYNWLRPSPAEAESFGGSSSARTSAKGKKRFVKVETESLLCTVCGERGHSWRKHYCSICDQQGHLETLCPALESFGGSSSTRTDAKKKKTVRVEAESKIDREKLVEDIARNLPPIEASRDVTASTLIHTIRRNLVVVRNLDAYSRVRGFFLCETMVVAPRHILLGSSDIKKTHLRISTHNVPSYDFTLNDVPYYIDEDKDVLIFTLPNSFQAKADITHYFIKQSDASDSLTSGYIVTALDNEYTQLVTDLGQKSYWEIQPLDRVDYRDNSDEILTVRGGLTYRCDSCEGECGSLIVRFDPSAARKILGFHIAGKIGVGYASLITQEYLRDLKTHLPLPIVHSEVYYEDEFYPCYDDVDEYFDAEGVPMEILGKLPESCVPHIAGESELVESPIFEKLQPALSAPALLKEKVVDGVRIDPYRYGMLRLQHPQIIFPQKVVDMAVKGMIASYAKWHFEKKLYGNVGLLTNDEMLNGIEGHPWIRPLNLLTSPGYPFQLLGGKSNFIKEGKMTPFLKEIVDEREQMALRGETKLAIIVDTLKDERLPIAKVKEGRTRIFSNCPLDVNLLFRKYFLKFLCFCMDNHVMGEVSVGINVHSEEWEVLFRRLQKKGKHWIGGDYTAWDKRTPLQIAMGLLDLVESFYKRFDDYDRSHALVRRVLIQQTFTGVHILPKGKRNLVYRVHQAMPSGIPLTAVYNSLLNLCLFRVVYILLAQKQGLTLSGAINDFENHVAVVAYGDDHIARVSALRFPWFNMLAIQQEMATYGIGYTAPDKSPIMPKELEENKLTYLKRSFRLDNGRINAPLALEHVIDILNWVRAKNEIEKKEAYQSAVRSVYIELTHFDRATFNYWFTRILRASVEAGIVVDVVTYEDALAARLNLQDDSSWAQF